jgi:hypothetical protein
MLIALDNPATPANIYSGTPRSSGPEWLHARFSNLLLFFFDSFSCQLRRDRAY